MILGFYKISGHSMEPYLKTDDYIFTLKYLPIKKNDIIVFRKNKKLLVKRVKKIIDENYYLEGDNKIDSLSVGKIKKNDILGKVIIKI